MNAVVARCADCGIGITLWDNDGWFPPSWGPEDGDYAEAHGEACAESDDGAHHPAVTV